MKILATGSSDLSESAKKGRIIFHSMFDAPIHTFVRMISQIVVNFLIAILVVYQQQGVVNIIYL